MNEWSTNKIRTATHTLIHAHTTLILNVCLHTSTQICLGSYGYTHTHSYIHTYIHMVSSQLYPYVHTHMHTTIWIYLHQLIYVAWYAYTNTYAHTYPHPQHTYLTCAWTHAYVDMSRPTHTSIYTYIYPWSTDNYTHIYKHIHISNLIY